MNLGRYARRGMYLYRGSSGVSVLFSHIVKQFKPGKPHFPQEPGIRFTIRDCIIFRDPGDSHNYFLRSDQVTEKTKVIEHEGGIAPGVTVITDRAWIFAVHDEFIHG